LNQFSAFKNTKRFKTSVVQLSRAILPCQYRLDNISIWVYNIPLWNKNLANQKGLKNGGFMKKYLVLLIAMTMFLAIATPAMAQYRGGHGRGHGGPNWGTMAAVVGGAIVVGAIAGALTPNSGYYAQPPQQCGGTTVRCMTDHYGRQFNCQQFWVPGPCYPQY
jgi:hypothetical protein